MDHNGLSYNAVMPSMRSFQEKASEMAQSRPTEFDWERARPRIYQLYIVEKNSLTDVMNAMADEGFTATSKMYTTRLHRWGYHKNVTRPKAVQALRQTYGNPYQRENGALSARNRVDACIYRNRIARLSPSAAHLHGVLVSTNSINSGSQCISNPLPDPVPLSSAKRIQWLLQQYTRQSFEEGVWWFKSNDRLIESSVNQSAVKASLHKFVGGLDQGCWKYLAGDGVAAELYWIDAFKQVDALVCDTYHDILPRIVQKLCSLQEGGFHNLAQTLANRVSQAARKVEPSCSPRTEIFSLLPCIPLDQMLDLEEKVLSLYQQTFNHHLGLICYNSFVTVINLAKRRLCRNRQLYFGECLPNLVQLDRLFGPSDRRSMDVLRIEAEVWLAWQDHEKVIELSKLLIDRAKVVVDDDWVKLYFWLKGLYLKSTSEYFLGRGEDARQSSTEFLTLEREFAKLSPGHRYKPERSLVCERLEKIYHNTK